MALYYRGQRVRFACRIEEGTPRPGYPTYEVRSPDGVVVAAGVGVPDNVIPGLYYATVVIPVDAPLGQGWVVDWRWETTDDRKGNYVEEFEVADVVLMESETRAQQTLALVGRPFRTFIRFMEPPYAVRADILDPESDTHVPGTRTDGYTVANGGLEERRDGDTIVYVLSETLHQPGSVVVLWEYQPTDGAPPYYQYEMVQVVPLKFVPYFTQLRQLIDKFQKTFGSRRAYEDAELIEYLQKGLDLINLYHPFTDWVMGMVPRSLETFWIMASAWYALNAQYLLEGDAAFDYSGLSVTLSVDRTGYIESELERLKSFLDEKVPPAKIAVLRMQHAGVVAGRGARPIPQYRYVGTWRRPRVINVNY